MTSLIAWGTVLLATSILDVCYSIARVPERAELNPAIRWLAKHIGYPSGVAVGVMVPTLSALAVGISLSSPSLISFVAGVRIWLAWRQAFLLSLGR